MDQNRRHLRLVLSMIITNAIVLHSDTTILVFGANSSDYPSRFFKPFSNMEKVQVTIFFVQEVTISSIYIWATVKFFRNSIVHTESTRTRMLWRLIVVNIIVILLDIAILGLEFASQ